MPTPESDHGKGLHNGYPHAGCRECRDSNPFSQSLAYLAILAKKQRDARLMLHASMTELREQGCPLREIAAATKLSHETVRRLTSGNN